LNEQLSPLDLGSWHSWIREEEVSAERVKLEIIPQCSPSIWIHTTKFQPRILTSIPFPDLIAVFGETTAQPFFITRLRDAMLRSPTGRRILRSRPRMTTTTLSVEHLRSLPPNTVGHAYYSWLRREKLSPGSRAQVRYIDDEECAYVMQRYRESHDFYHALTGLPTVREGEVALKAFEFANLGLPMTGLSVFSVFTLKSAERARFWHTYGPWAVRNGVSAADVINVFWEEELETDVGELRARLGIEKPPDLRDIRKREREEKRRMKEKVASESGAA
jgi:ubiquinone biosynthesis protein COQ4